jgi:drug/metabolite transporter (DMT)-like permease
LSERSRGIVYVLLAALAWSTGGLGIKVVHAAPLAIAGLRSLFALAVLALAVARLQARAPVALAPLLRRPRVWAAAGCYALMVVSFVVATRTTTAASAIFLQYTGPVYVALLSWPLLRERLRPRDGLAVAGCLAGMVLLFHDGFAGGGRSGDLWALVSSLGFAGLPLALRMEQRALVHEGRLDPATAAVSPLVAMGLGNVLAVLVTAPWIVRGAPTDARSWLVLAALGFVQIGVAYLLYAAGVRRLRAIEVTLVATLEPVLNPWGVVLGYGERPGAWALAGGAVIVATVTWQALGARDGDVG